MNIIIKEAKIIDVQSPFHNQIVDIKIEHGIITKIGKNILNPDKIKKLELDNLHVSQGWFDSSVSLGEPGFEDRETITNGLSVASKSGFTALAMQPNTFPVLDNQSAIHFVIGRATASATTLYPIGTLTKGSEGIDMAELYDMQKSGAIAFGDYNRSLSNANLLKIALQYVQDFDGLIIAYSQNDKIKGNGVAHEGITSTKLGLKGIPALAEEIDLARNLFLLEYTGGKLHIPTISTTKSVELIKEAKTKGLQVSCSVSVHHLVLTDEKLEGFDTRYKTNPPLRTETDRTALITAVKEGIIDFITTDHNPIDIEHKKVEFDLAKSGTIGLENAFGSLMTVLPLETIIKKFTVGKSIFNIPNTAIVTGEKANLTFFNPEGTWTFKKENILSKSKNSAFLNTDMKGKVYGIYNNNILVLK